MVVFIYSYCKLATFAPNLVIPFMGIYNFMINNETYYPSNVLALNILFICLYVDVIHNLPNHSAVYLLET